MKNKLRSILIVLLAVTCVVFAALGLAACDGVKLKELKIENARTEFKTGDEFEFGEDFVVYAVYSDGNLKDVTAEIECRFETGFDMNVAGNYQITVSWGGKREIYTIYVTEFDKILRKIELDTSSVKKEFELGDEVSFDGLEIICTYENAQGNPVITKTKSLKNFTVEIKGDKGSVVEDVFDSLDNFTVTISSGGISASYRVSVSGVNISTVQGAIAVGKAFSGNILSGTHTVKDTNPYAANPQEHTSYIYNYEFGINYLHLKETVEAPKNEYHYSIEDSGIFCVQFQYGEMVTPYNSQDAMINGSPFDLWYHRQFEYGVENLLTAMYNAAKECTNDDLVREADEAKREYSFSFSGLVFISNASDYYETSVKFTLGDDYAVKHVEYEQKYWEYSVLGAPFETDADGHTTPLRTYNQMERVTVDQISGERTQTNPYSRENMIVKSYDLTYNGQTLGDDGVVDCRVVPEGQPNEGVTVRIGNIQPDSANFMYDPMYLDYEGNFGGESSSMVVCTGFTAFRNGNEIKIYGKAGGVWKLILRTSKTYKTITLNITGLAPTSITPQVYNSRAGKFQDSAVSTSGVGGAIYFKGVVNQYANEAQTAKITSGNSANATIEETTVEGVKCFKFTAVQSGTYTVTVTSSAAAKVTCTFTFTVNELPDYSEILSGTYTVTDYEGNIYTIEFTPSEGDANSGTVVITKTPTTEDNLPLPGQAKTQTLTYSIDVDTLAIVLAGVSGEDLGVDFSVNDKGQLVLEDRYGDKYTLSRTNS